MSSHVDVFDYILVEILSARTEQLSAGQRGIELWRSGSNAKVPPSVSIVQSIRRLRWRGSPSPCAVFPKAITAIVVLLQHATVNVVV